VGKKEKQTMLVFVLLSIIAFLVPVSAHAFDEQVVVISVEEGDYLIKIGEEYLEDPHRWREVARINHLKNPDLIHPHQFLVIPVSLLRGIPCDGVVSFVQGNVRIQVRDSEEWKPLLIHDRVKEGSKIKTDDRSSAEIVFDNGTSCLQKSNTLIGFLKMRKKSDSYEQRLSLQRGRTITRILKATGREPRFEIETPSAVCAARGTFFRTSVDLSDYTRSEVLEGKAEVEAAMQKQVISEGEGTLVRKGEPPLKPRKLLPLPKLRQGSKIYNRLPLHFELDPVEGAVSYRISMAKDRDGKEIVYENIVEPNEKVEIQGMDDGTYFLHVVSVDEIGLEGVPSEPIEIHVRMNPLPPSIRLPVTSAEYREKSLQCNWLAVKDAVAYHLQLAGDHAFNQIVEERSAIARTTYETRELDYGNYYFRIRSVAEDGYEGAWSDTIPFAVVPPPPAPPIEPPEVDKKEIHIRWQDLGEGLSYHFQMAGDQDFSTVLIDRRLERPETAIQKPGEPGIYYVRVSAIDSKGYEGRFSKPQSFTLKEGSLALFLGAVATLILIFSLLP
jgi:hypothetical protein